VEPVKTALTGDIVVIAELSIKDLKKLLIATLSGMSFEEFASLALRRPGTVAGSAHSQN